MEFAFVSGNPALDLAGTLKWREDDPVDLLTGPSALAAWVTAAGLGPVARRIGRDDFTALIALREAIYSVATAVVDGTDIGSASRRLVNRTARTTPLTPRLTPQSTLTSQPTATTSGCPTQVRPAQIRTTGGCDALASTLARELLQLLDSDDRQLLRVCAGERCTRLFVDRSRGSTRRWCGMDECGNRAKAAGYRRRRSAAED